MPHIVLLGDSIFDNAAYVGGGLDVIAHLRRQIPPESKADLRAVDGSLVEDVAAQLKKVPRTATHLIISTGGNNAIANADILNRKASSTAEVFNDLASIGERFKASYRTMLQTARRLEKPFAVCTIYYPRFPEPEVQRIAVAALATFNDVIIREAVKVGVPLIDLRFVCDDEADYANPIEPSERGGEKIASAIMRLVEQHDFNYRRTQVFV